MLEGDSGTRPPRCQQMVGASSFSYLTVLPYAYILPYLFDLYIPVRSEMD